MSKKKPVRSKKRRQPRSQGGRAFASQAVPPQYEEKIFASMLREVEQSLQRPFQIAPPETVAGEKMSEALSQFLEPILHHLDPGDLHTITNAVVIGAAAWNAAMMPEEAANELYDILRERFDAKDQGELIELVRMLIARKRLLFEDDRRVIVDARVVDDGRGGFFLAAASMPLKPPS